MSDNMIGNMYPTPADVREWVKQDKRCEKWSGRALTRMERDIRNQFRNAPNERVDKHAVGRTMKSRVVRMVLDGRKP